MCSSGYVLPESYVDADAVERCYGSCRSFEYFLSSSLAVRRGLNEIVTFSDSFLKAAVAELLEKKYSVAEGSELDDFLKPIWFEILRVVLGRRLSSWLEWSG